MTVTPGRIIFIPHGGGPMPLMGEPGHARLTDFLRALPREFPAPEAIVVISAHWEEPNFTLTSAPTPPLIFDYFGFPPETYEYSYPSPGQPELARRIHSLLESGGIAATLDSDRGFDHGHFVPLKLMYPGAEIPTIQLSLKTGLDPAAHMQVGRTLSALRSENVLFLGSGLSFHNMQAFGDPGGNDRNDRFHDWLNQTMSAEHISETERSDRLANWAAAPEARYCHPREEHLLPLHVCYGLAQGPASIPFYDEVLGKKVAAFSWG